MPAGACRGVLHMLTWAKNKFKEMKKFMKKKILLVDDDKFIRDTFVERLRNNKHEVSSAKDGQEAIDKITADDFDVVITDIRMPRVNGIEVLKFTKKNKPKTKVVMMSTYVIKPHKTPDSCLEM